MPSGLLCSVLAPFILIINRPNFCRLYATNLIYWLIIDEAFQMYHSDGHGPMSIGCAEVDHSYGISSLNKPVKDLC